jgi:hypothetical protein
METIGEKYFFLSRTIKEEKPKRFVEMAGCGDLNL